jgi:hypothetical protein
VSGQKDPALAQAIIETSFVEIHSSFKILVYDFWDLKQRRTCFVKLSGLAVPYTDRRFLLKITGEKSNAPRTSE